MEEMLVNEMEDQHVRISITKSLTVAEAWALSGSWSDVTCWCSRAAAILWEVDSVRTQRRPEARQFVCGDGGREAEQAQRTGPVFWCSSRVVRPAVCRTLQVQIGDQSIRDEGIVYSAPSANETPCTANGSGGLAVQRWGGWKLPGWF